MTSRPMQGLLLALVCLMAGASHAASVAAGDRTGPASRPVELPGTYALSLQSRTGKDYRIFVSEPAAPAPPRGWPVVYVLDGNAWFVHASQLARIQGAGRPDKSGVLPAVVVGVGYPGDAYINSPRRTWDFTPDAILRRPNPERWAPTGGADEFMAFLRDELKPEVARRFMVDPDREILFGHSLGGLFALHAYFHHAGSFDAVVAASPSTWWNDDFIIDEAGAFAAAHVQAPPAAKLLIAMGGEELPQMVSGPRRVRELLAPLVDNGVDVALEELAGEDHLSAAPAALNRLMKRFLAPTADEVAHYLSQVPPERRRQAAGNGWIETTRRFAVQGGAHDGGREYAVREYMPAGVVPVAVQRTIYALQGGDVLSAALQAAAAATDATAVVALSAADGASLDDREWTPTASGSPGEQGGAEDLLRFLHRELVPAIASGRGRGSGDSVVVGSGLAGLFALYAASNEPGTFGAYVALDPATGWRNRFILSNNVIGRLAPKLSARQTSTRLLLVTDGEAPEATRLLAAKLQAMDGVGMRLEQARDGHRVQALADAIERGFSLRDEAVPARKRVFGADTGIPVPDVEAYLRLTPQQRFDLRMHLRGLGKDPQTAWTEQFKYNMDAELWFLEHRLLHEEKERMDTINGYAPMRP